MLEKILAILTTGVVSMSSMAMMNTKNETQIENKMDIQVETQQIIEENQSTTEIPSLTQQQEQALETENLETEGFEEQGNVAYEGDYITDKIQIGNYQGLTYYSQIDSRWKNKLYTSVGNSSQTIGTSGCGPTSAAMVVSSIRGTITPDIMANLYVRNGYRSTNNGTYLAAFSWTADYFNIGFERTSSLDKVVELLKNNYYVVASCQSGQFTYGGHLIVLVGIEGNNLKIYDPYLYSGKFETSTRRGKCSVEGNTVYMSIENFRKYANASNFFAYKNDRTDIIQNNKNVNTSTYTRYVNANIGLNVRQGAGTQYKIISALSKGTQVTIYENIGEWSRIGDNQWVCSRYLTEQIQSSNIKNNVQDYSVKITANIGLNIRSGPGTRYKKIGAYSKDAIVTIKQKKQGWGKTDKGWIYLQYTNENVSKSLNSVGKIKILKNNTILFSNSNLTGKKYYYLPNTSVIVLQNVNSYIDKIKVRQTGRIAYININNYK